MLNERLRDQLVLASGFNKEKVLGDLRAGFRVTCGDQHAWDSQVYVATSLGQDVFITELSEGYQRFDCTIRRKKRAVGSGSATLERWTVSARPDRENKLQEVYRIQENNGGELEEPEFWRRYNASAVDYQATQVLFEYVRQEVLKKQRGARFSWMAEENPQFQKLFD